MKGHKLDCPARLADAEGHCRRYPCPCGYDEASVQPLLDQALVARLTSDERVAWSRVLMNFTLGVVLFVLYRLAFAPSTLTTVCSFTVLGGWLVAAGVSSGSALRIRAVRERVLVQLKKKDQ